tara:strand:- start:98 stop:304 length:207 start_codon:yes stop_codon:yes gene_type:complete
LGVSFLVDTRSILISLEDLKRMKLNENQLKLTIYLIDYYVLKEKQKPRGIVSLREKCEYLLGYKVVTT